MMTDICKICEEEIEEDPEHFHIYKFVGNEGWSMDFHYECAIKDEFVEEFINRDIDIIIE